MSFIFPKSTEVASFEAHSSQNENVSLWIYCQFLLIFFNFSRLFMIQILAILITQTVPMKLFCDCVANSNTCKVTDIQVSNSNDQTVTNVFGSYQPRKSLIDVKIIDARGLTLTRFPLNLNKFLPNIETVFFEKGMTEIHKEELAQYPNLKELYISTNEIKVIEPDLFIKNRHLQLIFLNANKIKSVAPNVFDGLYNLKYLGFDTNVCYSGKVENDHERSKELIKNIYKNCAPAVPTNMDSCVPKKEFEDFRLELKSDIGELTEQLQKWREETQHYVKIGIESCDTD